MGDRAAVVVARVRERGRAADHALGRDTEMSWVTGRMKSASLPETMWFVNPFASR